MVEYTDDETRVTMGAHRYRAKDGVPGKCDGCFMKNGFGCHLIEAAQLGIPYEQHTFGMSRCMPEHRKDGRSIIWVLDV